MDYQKLWDFLKSLPAWARIVAILAAAIAAIALSSCQRRMFSIQAKGDHVEFLYRDSLVPKTFIR